MLRLVLQTTTNCLFGISIGFVIVLAMTYKAPVWLALLLFLGLAIGLISFNVCNENDTADEERAAFRAYCASLKPTESEDMPAESPGILKEPDTRFTAK